jgi:Ca-activated chloride channel family protein
MKFTNISVLYLMIALVPLWLIVLVFVYKRYLNTIKKLFSQNLVPKLISPNLLKIQKINFIIYFLVFSLFLFVLSGPQWGLKPQEVKTYGVDVILVIDVSKSMLTEDVLPNRLEFVKHTCEILLNRLETHRVGIITFAGVAFYHCPLTLDLQSAKDLLSIIDTDIVPYPGTKIGLALEEALRVFKEYSRGSKVVILFTDGEDHDSYSSSIGEEMKKNGIVVYTVGVGTPEGKVIPIRDQQGRIVDYKKDKQGNIVTSKLNEQLLYEIAEKTNGKYFSSNYGELRIAQQIINEISNLKQTQLKSKVYNLYTNRYHYFVYTIIILLLTEIFLVRILKYDKL